MDLFKEVEQFINGREGWIEDWRDQARFLIGFVKHKGYGVLPVMRPERTGLGSYMYVVPCLHEGINRWFIYDAELGIAEFGDKEPVPSEWS